MLWLALHLPSLSLEAYCATLPQADTARPVALLGAQGLSAVNALAAQRGLRAGQRRATALALVPDLLLGQADPARDAAALLAVAHAALAFTPMVVLDGDRASARSSASIRTGGAASAALDASQALTATVLMEVQPSLRLFGGLTGLLQRLDAALVPLGHQVLRAAAAHPAAAALLARWQPSARAVSAALGSMVRPARSVAAEPNDKSAVAIRRRRVSVDGKARTDAPSSLNPPPPRPIQSPSEHLLHSPHTHQPAALAALLGAAPVEGLRTAQTHAEALLGMGVHTLADLTALPRSGLARRFGAALLDELDRLHGRRPDPRVPLLLPAAFDAALELHARADTTDQVLAGAQVLLGWLLAWAQGRQVRLRAFALRMRHDRHRGITLPATVLRIELAEPTLDPAHLRLLLRERLGRCTLAAPTLSLALHCHEVAAGAAPNAELFPSRQAEAEGLAQLLERLRARLGDAAVHRVLPVADHRPERAQQQVPAQGAVQPLSVQPLSVQQPSVQPLSARAADAAAVTLSPPAHLPLSRPAWLLPVPQPLHVAVHERLPRYQGRVLCLLSGPERIETGWWDGHPVARDYYIAADEDGTLLWIWRERLPAADEADPAPQWFLHGRFA
jgi:protein ImuB